MGAHFSIFLTTLFQAYFTNQNKTLELKSRQEILTQQLLMKNEQLLKSESKTFTKTFWGKQNYEHITYLIHSILFMCVSDSVLET